MKTRYYIIIVLVIVFSASAFFYSTYAHNIQEEKARKVFFEYFKPELKPFIRNYTKKDIVKYKKEAASGNVSAEFNLGNAYVRGKGVKKNYFTESKSKTKKCI
jgi:TPR repeat protein